MSNFVNCLQNANLAGYTLIIPSVSVGNVPQLTVDLIITSLKLQKAATIWHPAFVPCIGHDPYSASSEVCTACELYTDKNKKLAVFQLRSSLEGKMALKFFQDLKAALIKIKLKNVVILSSVFDFELHNIMGEKFYYISNRDIELLEQNGVKQFHRDLTGKWFLNGGGFATKLYEILEDSIECVIIGKYISEGDNRPDAYSILTKLLIFLGANASSEIIYPSSWQFVFGGPPPVGIF